MNKALLAGVLIAMLLNAGCGREFRYAGTIEATEIELAARVNAVIESRPAGEGMAVKKGAVLVTLSGDDIRVSAAAAERDYRRAVQLLETGSLNQEAFDKLKFKRDDAQVRLSWCTITAPIDGTVITVYREPGEMVVPGSKLLSLADLSRVWSYIYIPQPLLAQIQLNMPVEALVPESGDKTITGRIIKINDEAEFTPKNVQTRKERTRLVYGVKIEFSNADNFLKPGMTVEVKLPAQAN